MDTLIDSDKVNLCEGGEKLPKIIFKQDMALWNSAVGYDWDVPLRKIIGWHNAYLRIF